MLHTSNSAVSCASTCVFCRELSSHAMPEEYVVASGIRNRIVYEDDEFFVLPSLSPLAVGHVMLVPKEHVTSSVQLSGPTFARLAELRSSLAHAIEQQGQSALFWEHGIAVGATGGCGVFHAHVHALPLPTEDLRSLAMRLEQGFSETIPALFGMINQVASSDSSYLYWSIGDEGHVNNDTQVTSQFMRRAVANVLGSSAWDWKDLSNWDLFKSTFQMWKHRPFVALATL